MINVPFGQKESLTLEFKGRDTLQDLSAVGREVVAMLNAQGGEIWVGLREEQGRAVLVERLEKPELERQRLRDYLVDSIEPRLSSEEVVIDEVADDTGQVVLRLKVKPKESNRPYALLKQNARYFLTRFEDRLRLMTREEIFQARSKGHPSTSEELIRKALENRESAAKEHRKRLWLRIAPDNAPEIDVQSEEIRLALMEPKVTGNRESGWNFVEPEYRPELGNGWVQTRGNPLRQLTVYERGEIVYWASLDMLTRFRDQRDILWPLAVLEVPVSVLRLAHYIYRDLALETQVAVDLALFDVASLPLAPGSPLVGSYLPPNGRNLPEGSDFLLDRPLLVTVEELRDGDRVGLRLARKIYQAWGFSESDIPREFDRKTGRLVLPE